jgi:hypothetical protein
MKRLTVVCISLLALALAGSAAAKGPSEARITGPGLESGLMVRGVGEGDPSTDLGLLVADAGFFPQVFGQSPSPMLKAQPTELGPRYIVTYTVPGPTESKLEQDLYPFAAGAPASYMRPGQRFWDTQSTIGGWYRGSPELKSMLLHAGLPASPPQEQSFIALVLRAILRHFS